MLRLVRGMALALTATATASCIGPRISSGDFRGTTEAAPETPAPLVTSWFVGVPIVEASIDGHGPLRFVLDSGASVLAVDRRVADALRLERVDLTDWIGLAPSLDAGEGTFRVEEGVRIREIRAGPFVGRNCKALVLDLSDFERSSGTRIDGVLPASLFRSGLLTIDPARGAVTYAAGELPPADGKDVFAMDADDRSFVSIDLGGSPCRFLVDTGSAFFLNVPAERQASLRFHRPPQVVGQHWTMAGDSPRRLARIDGTVAWGRCRIVDPIVGLTAADYGNAGIRFLRQLRTTFDFAHRRVRFERDDDAPIRSPPIRSIGVWFLHDGGVVTVGAVAPGGPADHVRKGDRVESIDGRPASEIRLYGEQELFEGRESVTLRIVRDGATRDFTIAVQTLVE